MSVIEALFTGMADNGLYGATPEAARAAIAHLAASEPGRIAALEAACGVRLLDRDRRRRVTPTPSGVELLRYAERMMALQAEMLAGSGPSLRPCFASARLTRPAMVPGSTRTLRPSSSTATPRQ